MSMLYLIRHGETDFHVQKKALGRLDIGLNELGMRQAGLVAEALRGKGIKAVYSSPLARCLQTARPLAEALGLEVGVREGLQEIDLGEWDGMPFSRIYEEGGEVFARWLRSPAEVRIPGGELLEEVRERVIGAVNGTLSLYYYLKVVYAAYFVDSDLPPIELSWPTRILNYALCAVILVFGVAPDAIIELARAAVKNVL